MPTAGSAAQAAPTPAPRKQTLDGEVFLRLLVTQLTNQDPSSPMDTNAMISQTTQLASMEQLTAMSKTGTEAFALSMRQAATALIGQEVGYTDAAGKAASGVVSKVSFAGAVPTVTIGSATVALDAITGITTRTTPAPTGQAG
ncbi:flagellar hook capping FlgD N-terminal domain-containing protein [uncultured Microbacterium sp.]|uniref:flagellar hook capping FlgD N-terminal domain-containing protein n=1 Tax=uncultured Microbacterium sp. TaxID=191216 RepID=UPI0025D605DE|nr:flagellar hook capping FlgD N-terminal domain-containing protein [uncultured Microbacterium sp.]